MLETWNQNFKFQVFPDCHGKKQTNSFVHFLGESMARQSAFGFIWTLMKLQKITNNNLFTGIGDSGISFQSGVPQNKVAMVSQATLANQEKTQQSR